MHQCILNHLFLWEATNNLLPILVVGSKSFVGIWFRSWQPLILLCHPWHYTRTNLTARPSRLKRISHQSHFLRSTCSLNFFIFFLFFCHSLSSVDEMLLNMLTEKAFNLIGVEWLNSGALCGLYMILNGPVSQIITSTFSAREVPPLSTSWNILVNKWLGRVRHVAAACLRG